MEFIQNLFRTSTPWTQTVSNLMILAQVVLQIFCPQCSLWLKCLSLKRGIIQCSQNSTKSSSGHLHHVPKQYAWYNPSSSSSPDVLLTRLLNYTRCRSRKRDITNIYRNLQKVNQVIYTLDTICMPNIMILAQVVLQIFWKLTRSHRFTMHRMTKGDNSAKYLQNFSKS